MGAYLSEPNLNKESVDDSNNKISFGASSMQGWRLDQEVGDLHKNYFIFISNLITVNKNNNKKKGCTQLNNRL
jgi:hypothetical protein